jgi:flagellar hook assembly protein FlgD
LNEFLFNPKSGGVVFIEVYNQSGKYISTKKWMISNYVDGVATNQKELNMINPSIPPNSFQVFTPDPGILKSHYPRAIDNVLVTTTLPSLPDDEGTIALIDSIGNVIDFFHYTDDYHSPFLKDDEGVSLERISISTETNSKDNWKSASQAENFATPGYKNSASSTNSGNILGDVFVDPEIFSPEVPPNDYTRINYRFDQSGKVANVQIFDHQGRVIKVLANNEVLPTEGFFRWDGDRDDGGRARAGYYVAIVEVFDVDGVVSTFRKRVVIAYR